MRKLTTGRQGFTPVELLIIVFVIAIFVAIAIPVYLNSKANADKRICQSNQRTVDSAIQSYQANDSSQRYPTTWKELISSGQHVIRSIPTCPSGGKYSIVMRANPPFLSCTKHPPPGN